ncbi:MAG: ribonuclease HII [Leptolinea sp.]|nr:ribonuclease HII [Leptolinea sp.]
MGRGNGKFIPPSKPDLSFEKEQWKAGSVLIAGLDEAGRGSWAGPVMAGAVILPCNDQELEEKLLGVRDSKQLSANQREKWAKVIRKIAIAVAWGKADCFEIDEMGILPATRLAMCRALQGLDQVVDHLLIDAVKLPMVNIPQTSLIKGDARSLTIAAASIIAKTERDHLMELLEEKIPGYGFSRHKGYGTFYHRQALAERGVSPEHRRSYLPIRSLLETTKQ